MDTEKSEDVSLPFEEDENGSLLEFRLPTKEWQAFCLRLDEPPKIIPALQKLSSEPEPFDL